MALSLEVVRNIVTAAYNEDPHVSEYINPNRPEHIIGVFREQLTPGSNGLIPITVNIVGEQMVYKTPDLMVLNNFLQSHHETPQFGRAHTGIHGNLESWVVRAFHLNECNGELLAHQFIFDPRELEELLVPKEVINKCFPFYEGLRAARRETVTAVQERMRLQYAKIDPKYTFDSPYYYEDGKKIWRT